MSPRFKGRKKRTYGKGVRPHKKAVVSVGEYGCLALILVCFGLLAAWFLQSTGNSALSSTIASDLTSQPDAPSPVPTPKPNNRVNILVLGIDRRPSEQCPCRSDVMILGTLDPDTLTAGLITIPRDLYVSIPTIGTNRINTAMFYGELRNYPGKGPGLAKVTTEKIFGRTVQHYVVVDFSGFRKLVDAVGGIDINVPQAIDDPTFPNDTFGIRPLHIPAGLVHMNGDLALAYARTRHADNDFGRSKRQIQVLLAMRDRALRFDVIPKLPGLVQALWGIVDTDLSPQDIINLAQVAARVKPENIKSASIDETMTTEYYSREGEYFLIPNLVKISRLFDQMIPLTDNGIDATAKLRPETPSSTRPETPSPTRQETASPPRREIASPTRQETASIIVLNGTDIPGLAERTAQFLLTQGFPNVAFDNADRFDYNKTLLSSSGRNFPSTIDALAGIFHISTSGISIATDQKSKYDIRVILGRDWILPQLPAGR